ncbi:hypothetical protein EKO04_005628 [Ascochyta lentis]|uniref:Uncharacterized protein n=1 Tax=Ascochyta lentis TaxID=205686 RepID=A0A8H7J552_9PLEO|nr:hypothetical protein EKO04_005628 [Ascochyta lentis]
MRTTNVLLALMSFFAIALVTARACKEGSLQCGGGDPGGAVFACKNGAWEVLVVCHTAESCKNDPIAHCTWASANTGSADSDPVSGFEGLSIEVSAATDSKDTTADTAQDSTAGSNDSPYWDVCTPCIRHNDYCRQSCAWQGDECNATCNWKTCSVNLTTGDLRQPTVACDHVCKWPCH